MIKEALIKVIPAPILKKYREIRIRNEERQKAERDEREFVRLREKWLQHDTVKEWRSKGWLTDDLLTPFMVSTWENCYEKFGEPVPWPPKGKYEIIAAAQREHDVHTLVETGTYLGAMIEAQLNNFKTIYTIEISEDLHKKAVEKFKDDHHVHLLLGDSGEELPKLIPQLTEPALFWLDGHYSHGITGRGAKDCPIFEELEGILNNPHGIRHVILIDDMRCFDGIHYGYPSIEEVSSYIRKIIPDSKIVVEHDIMTVSFP